MFKQRLYEIIITFAGLCIGTIPIFSALLRDNGLSSIDQVFLRSLYSGTLAILFLLLYRKNNEDFELPLQMKTQRIYALQGILLTIMIFSYLSSIAVGTPVGEAALLVQIHPIITVFFGWLILNETITLKKGVALILTIIGSVVLLRPWDFDSFFEYLLGDLFALLNGVLYSVYLMFSRSQKDNLPSNSLINGLFIFIWAFISSLPITLLMSTLPLDSSITAFNFNLYLELDVIILSISLGFIGSILSYTLIAIASKHIESSRQSILLTGESVAAVVLGSLILLEPISWNYIIGGVLLLSAIIITAYSKPYSKKIIPVNV